MITFKVGGVPEHFNMPLHYLAAHPELNPDNIRFQWEDYPGGTGDLVKSLDNGELDLATLLTEGAIKGIDSGAGFRILNFFVDSPLIWGIHVPASSNYHSIEHVKGKKYAISRYGSGSHLISYLDARNRDWPTKELDFVEVGGMEGAREAFRTDQADVFLWEKFTTKPLVDRGEFRILGECVPGFSSFVVCVSNKTWKNHRERVQKLLESVLRSGQALLSNSALTRLIADHYQMEEADVASWLERTSWTTQPDLDQSKLEAALKILKELSLVKDTLRYQDLIVE